MEGEPVVSRYLRRCRSHGSAAAYLVVPALVLVASCRRDGGSTDAAAVPAARLPGLVSGTNAFAELRAFLSLGPRVANTPGAEAAARYLYRRLSALGLDPLIDTFTQPTPEGTGTFHNVLAPVPGTDERVVILASHYDTKAGIADAFAGANDSGSSTALLLELARVLAATERRGPDVLLAFFDGEECHTSYSHQDGLHGSRRLAETLVRNRRSGKVLAVLVLDMVGDRDLTITLPRNTTPSLRPVLLRAARDVGLRHRIALSRTVILDDHVPFLRHGMPAADIIDFQYGPAGRGNEYWHTPEDTIDKISARSLEEVGRIVLRAVELLGAGGAPRSP